MQVKGKLLKLGVVLCQLVDLKLATISTAAALHSRDVGLC